MKNNLKNWEQQKRLIPVMIKKYCHGKHHTYGKNICEECQDLTNYALLRLDKCPFKENKSFCSSCKVHCYQNEYRLKIKEVMKYSGPRMIFTHPIFCFKHVIETIKNKKNKM